MTELLPDVSLWDWQYALNNECTQAMRDGHKHVVMQSPTGSGKSRMASAQIVKAYNKGWPVAFLVPRRELVYQMSDHFNKFGLEHSYVVDKYPFNPYRRLHICTPGTLVNRLGDINPRLLFIDETHLGGAVLDAVIQYYYARDVFSVGLTATPGRHDGRGLNRYYSTMVKGPQIKWLIGQGNLSGFKLFGADTPDYSKLRRVAGDYHKGDMSEFMAQSRVLVGHAVDQYVKTASGKRNICFCFDKLNMNITNELFKERGIPSACVDDKTPDDERKRIFKALARRELLNVCSVDLITTGFDLSAAAGMDCTVESMSDLASTASLPKQMQKWGRTLRAKPFDAIINDHVGNSYGLDKHGNIAIKHGMPDAERHWSLMADKAAGELEKATPTRQCKGCGMWEYPKPVCSFCGVTHPVQTVEVKTIDAELVQMTSEQMAELERIKLNKRMRQGMAKTPEELLRHLVEEGAKSPVYQAEKILGGRKTPATRHELYHIYAKIMREVKG